METGSVYRAKYQMQWAGLILLIMPFGSYQICNMLIENRIDFWISFFIIGIMWTLIIYSYVVGKIWGKIRKRYVNAILNKIVNYHLMCVTSIANEDYKRVEFILNKCLEKYDSSSMITFYIKGAYAVGTKDMRTLKTLEKDLKEIEI